MLDVILATWIISYLECYCLENIVLSLSAYLTIFLLTYDAKCALKFMPFLCDCQAVAVYLLMLWTLVAVPDKLLIIHAFCVFCLLVMSGAYRIFSFNLWSTAIENWPPSGLNGLQINFQGFKETWDRQAGWRLERCDGDQKSDCRRPPSVAVIWWSDSLTRARPGKTKRQTLFFFLWWTTLIIYH